MKQETKQTTKASENTDSIAEQSRREFLGQLGKYSVVASATTVTLLSSKQGRAAGAQSLSTGS